MKQLCSSILALVLMVSLAGAQDVINAENAEKRTIGSFHAIETAAGIEVILTKSSKEELAVTATDRDMLPKVRTVVVNGVLKINREDTWKFWNQWKNWRVKVYVSYVNLDGVEASSGGSIVAKDVNLEKVRAEVSSGGTINLTGKVNNLNVDASSGGQFRGYDLQVAVCKVDASSGGGIQVTVSKEISAEASSGGFVRFKGEGLIRNIDVSSGGSVKRQTDK